MSFSLRASFTLLCVLLLSLTGCGKSSTPAPGKTDAGGKPETAATGDSKPTSADAAATGSPAGFPAGDIRNFVPADGQVAGFFQPNKLWQSKLVTTLVPQGERDRILKKLKREAPLNPETVAKVAIVYSPTPAGFPEPKEGYDPSANFTAVIAFNDSLKMSDRFKPLLEKSPLNTLKGLSGEAWWGSRKEMIPDDAPRPATKMSRTAEKGPDGKITYRKYEYDGKGKGKSTETKMTEEEYEKEQKKEREEYETRIKLMQTPNRRVNETPEPFDIIFFAPNDQTLVIGLKVRVEAIAKGSGPSALRELLKDAEFSHDLILAGAGLNEFKLPEKVQQEMARDRGLAPAAMVATMVPSKARQLLVQVGASPGANLIDLQVTAVDEATATELEKQLSDGKQAGLGLANPLLGQLKPESQTPAKQLVAELDSNWKLSRTGAKLRASLAHTEKLNQLAIDTAQPILKDMEKAAGVVTDRNNAKMIGLSVHNFENSFRKFPPGGGKGDPRETLAADKQVGWLFDLLPFMEQANLYYGIKKDKAWDDPANKPFGATIVPFYVSSEIPTEMVNGYAPTHFVGIGGLGENGPNEPADSKKAGAFSFTRPTKFGDFKDGTSNTMIGAQAYKNFGPWIANTNATIRPFTKKPYLGGPDGIGGSGPNGQTIILMGDGSVRTINNSIDPSVIEAMSTINGGEPVENK